MENKKRDILDLRFIIALFFLIVGLLLTIGSFVMETTAEKSEATNFWSGLVYVIFGGVMLLLWLFGSSEEEHQDEP